MLQNMAINEIKKKKVKLELTKLECHKESSENKRWTQYIYMREHKFKRQLAVKN